MNKILTAIAALAFAVGAMLTPTAPAEAGFKGRLAIGLALGAIALSHQRYEERRHRERRYYARRKAEKKVYSSKKSSSSTKKIAKAEPEPEVEKVETPDKLVENENSSISTAALVPVEESATIGDNSQASEPAKVVAEIPETEPPAGPKTANKLDCKKFFPTVGITLSVSCE